MRVKATIEAPGGISWAIDGDTASRSPGLCIVGDAWPKALFADGRQVGMVHAIEHMDTDEVYGDSHVPFSVVVNSTTLNCVLFL